jgi:hypothetical protein
MQKSEAKLLLATLLRSAVTAATSQHLRPTTTTQSSRPNSNIRTFTLLSEGEQEAKKDFHLASQTDPFPLDPALFKRRTFNDACQFGKKAR